MTFSRGFAALLLATAAPAYAQEEETERPLSTATANDDTLTIGAGIGYVPSYEGSDDYNFSPAAAIRGKVSGHNFYTRGTSLYFDLIPEAPGNNLDLSFGPAGYVRLNRTSRIKDAQVRALGELDTAIELGAFAGIAKTGVITSDFDTLSFRVAYFRDVSDTHDSYVIQPVIEYGTPLSQVTYVGASLSADIVGDGFADTYFSVTPAGTVASGLPTYTAEGGIKDVTAALFANQSLTGDLRRGLSLFALGSYSRLLGDFKRSPIVRIAGDKDQYFAAVGLAYTF